MATPPDYSGPRPEPAVAGYASVVRDVRVDVPRVTFLAWVNAPGRELGDMIETADDLTRVVGTVNLRGDFDPAVDRTGHRRRVEQATGHYLAEEVLDDTPDEFRYMIWGFTDPRLRLAARYAVARFAYADDDGATRIHWAYSFMPTTPLLRPVVGMILSRAMGEMMRRTLTAWKDAAEREAR
ncbi:SRPBCC family protein [Myceligenerans pegani]|uniref:SRPBCC family protein n=1 Tax=Myceligenerans pegani TaxID=2776917 RepID=A0ABR9N430_9MICO|nr:SRPBCC family protein [Myceligenerans sp. TRM 65318]MBE1878420.1 hypothetical protein [Myceligenerans sp. TRM 65318]MBE3020691.1 hypothetical protein [Myceligenerans sp. TRM 65318]